MCIHVRVFYLLLLSLSLSLKPKDDSEANGSEPSSLSSPVSGGAHQGELRSRETTDTEAAGEAMKKSQKCPLESMSGAGLLKVFARKRSWDK